MGESLERQHFSLGAVNEFLKRFFSANMQTQGLNYTQMLAFEPKKKISVVGRYIAPDPASCVTLAPSSESSTGILLTRALQQDERYYYGVSPRFDTKEAISLISSAATKGGDVIDTYIETHASWFMANERLSTYLPAFARYIVIANCEQFGLKIHMSEAEANSIIESLAKVDSAYCKLLVLDTEKPKTKSPVTAHPARTALMVYGIPSTAMLSELEKRQYLTDEDGIHLLPNGEHGLHIKDVYAKRSNISLLKGEVYYSGVLPKPVSIEELEDLHENKGITSLEIGFELSTFATVLALDSNFLSRPLLDAKSREAMQAMLLDDERAKVRLCPERCWTNTEEALEAVNAYLGETCNVNQIGVSADVISKDSLLITGLRAGRNIDSGMVYPGVNGNVEIADTAVSFYRTSVYEDLPSIHLDEHRVDFLGEIGREAYAELRLESNDRDWNCIGLSLSGSIPTQTPEIIQTVDATRVQSVPESRRMHFNILFEQTVELDFLEINKRRKKAAEKFESAEIRGIRYIFYESRMERMQRILLDQFIPFVVDKKDLMESALLLVIVCSAIMRGKDPTLDGVTELVQTALSSVFALFIAIDFIVQFIELQSSKSQLHKQTTKSVFFMNLPYSKFMKTLEDSLRFGKYVCHPVTVAAVASYCFRRAYEEFFQNDAQR